jgi:hypothetical protein
MLRRALVAGLVLVGSVAIRAGDPLLTMLDPYFRIQSALSDDKTEGVTAEAKAIATAAKAMGEPGVPIAKAADALAHATDLGAARTAFSQLSDAVIKFSESTKAEAGEGVHAMYCPMANKQWMQKGEKVSNPYYGKSMLTCGEKKKKST